MSNHELYSASCVVADTITIQKMFNAPSTLSFKEAAKYDATSTFSKLDTVTYTDPDAGLLFKGILINKKRVGSGMEYQQWEARDQVIRELSRTIYRHSTGSSFVYNAVGGFASNIFSVKEVLEKVLSSAVSNVSSLDAYVLPSASTANLPETRWKGKTYLDVINQLFGYLPNWGYYTAYGASGTTTFTAVDFVAGGASQTVTIGDGSDTTPSATRNVIRLELSEGAENKFKVITAEGTGEFEERYRVALSPAWDVSATAGIVLTKYADTGNQWDNLTLTGVTDGQQLDMLCTYVFPVADQINILSGSTTVCAATVSPVGASGTVTLSAVGGSGISGSIERVGTAAVDASTYWIVSENAIENENKLWSASSAITDLFMVENNETGQYEPFRAPVIAYYISSSSVIIMAPLEPSEYYQDPLDLRTSNKVLYTEVFSNAGLEYSTATASNFYISYTARTGDFKKQVTASSTALDGEKIWQDDNWCKYTINERWNMSATGTVVYNTTATMSSLLNDLADIYQTEGKGGGVVTFKYGDIPFNLGDKITNLENLRVGSLRFVPDKREVTMQLTNDLAAMPINYYLKGRYGG